ncbi:MAG: hypothetical protein K2P87_08640 [Lachnospiraceae bacterium]|nr:hypothetical protein [Lachnospiraceae bacterium]
MQGKKRKLLVLLLLVVMAAVAVPLARVQAAGSPLTIVEIDYEKETMLVSSGNSDSYLYYSDAKRKNWECAGTFDASGRFVLDISWVSKTKDYVLVLKGDKSGEVSVTLPKQDRSFKATYNFMKESLTYQNAEGREVYWRKADSTVWKKVEMDTATRDAFRRLYARGAYIYLRTGQVKGSGSNAGSRPSKEVKLSLTKQAAAPKLTVKLPGTVTVNDKMEYQVEGADTWTACSGKTLDIAKTATKAFYQDTTPGSETKIFLRVAATEKKLPSANAVLTVLAQAAAPTDIKNEFINTSTLQLTIEEIKDDEGNVTREKPSSKNPYEYTVVEDGSQPKEDAKWTAITSEKVQISATKAPKDAAVYIRKRGQLDGTAAWQPESLSYKYVVEEYPAGGTLTVDADTDAAYMKEGVLYLVKQEGAQASGLTFGIVLTEQFKDNDISGITCGGKSLKFTSSKSADGLRINAEITDTSEYEGAVETRDKEQTVKITLKNGEVIEKVKLTILHGASVKLAKTFSVTHGLEPDSPYEFIVVPGLTLEKTGEEYGKTTVAKLSFMGEEITSYTNSTETDGSYKIGITAAVFNSAFLRRDTELDKAYPLTIEMSNGQKLAKGVSVKLYEDVKAEVEQSYTKPVGTELEEDIVLKLTTTKTAVSVTGATWNGQQIAMLAEQSGNTVTVTLKHESLNALTLPVAGQGCTAPIIFTVDNGNGKKSLASLVYWLTLTP